VNLLRADPHRFDSRSDPRFHYFRVFPMWKTSFCPPCPDEGKNLLSKGEGFSWVFKELRAFSLWALLRGPLFSPKGVVDPSPLLLNDPLGGSPLSQMGRGFVTPWAAFPRRPKTFSFLLGRFSFDAIKSPRMNWFGRPTKSLHAQSFLRAPFFSFLYM